MKVAYLRDTDTQAVIFSGVGIPGTSGPGEDARAEFDQEPHVVSMAIVHVTQPTRIDERSCPLVRA